MRPGPVHRRLPALAVALLIAIASPVALANDKKGGEVGLLVGAVVADKEMTGDDSSTTEPLLGVRGGSVFSRRWGWFVDAYYSEVGTRGSIGDGRTFVGRSGFDYLFSPLAEARWFVSGGAGWMAVDYESSASADFHNPFASLGFGQRIRIGEDLHLRWELRGDHTLDDARLTDDLVQGHALIGIQWGPGSPIRYGVPAGGDPRQATDADLDGVRNRRDRCPDTPQGATVDGEGCPLDDDRDGVPNGLDQCPGTRRTERVDSRGCPSDGDRDGVPDMTDFCANTPAGAKVDEWGCPRDSDGDGVLDGLDACPATAEGVSVDERGCP